MLVTVLAVVFDLAIAIVAGVLWSAVANAWDNGRVHARSYTRTTETDGPTKVYVLQNDLIFSAIDSFR